MELLKCICLQVSRTWQMENHEKHNGFILTALLLDDNAEFGGDAIRLYPFADKKVK